MTEPTCSLDNNLTAMVNSQSLAMQKEVDSLANQTMLQGVLKHNNKDNVESLKTLVSTETEEGSEHLVNIETNLQTVVLDKENLDIDDAGDKQITTSDTTKFKCVARIQSYFGGLSWQFASILAIASLFIITLATTLYWKLYTPKRELSQTVQILNLIAYFIEEIIRLLIPVGRGTLVYSFLFHCLFFPVQTWIDFELSKHLKPTFKRIRQPNFLIISCAIMSLVISLAYHYIEDDEGSQIISLAEQAEYIVEIVKHFILNDLWFYSGIIHALCIPAYIWFEYMEKGICINFNPYKPFAVVKTWKDLFFVWMLSSIFAMAIYFYDDLLVFFDQYSTPEPTLLEKTSIFIFGEPQPEQDLIEQSFEWMLHTPLIEWITDNIEPLVVWMKGNIDPLVEWMKDNMELLVEWIRNTSLVEWMSNNLLISLELFVLTSPIIMYLVFYTGHSHKKWLGKQSFIAWY
uniref:Transmembrane protein n=1 Tax=Clytia hemisphaerica TaxID=252671 RepID=A0A7M5X4A2_9CNID